MDLEQINANIARATENGATVEDNLRAAHKNFALMQRDNAILVERQERLIEALKPYCDVIINAQGHMKIISKV